MNTFKIFSLISLMFAGQAVLASGVQKTAVKSDVSESSSYTVQMLNSDLTQQTLQTAFPKVKIHALFAANETTILKKFHHEKLASTLLLGPIAEANRENFLNQFGLQFPKLKLEKNYALKLTATPESGDPLFSEQWAFKNTGQSVRIDLDDLRTYPLHTIPGEDMHLPTDKDLPKLKEVVVAVLDTGIDPTHPDLKTQLRVKSSECDALVKYLDCMNTLSLAKPAVTGKDAETQCIAKVGNTDTDHNGYPMDCVGWSVTSSLSTVENSPLSRVLGTPDMDDGLGHGTHVAGIIAAAKNNQLGVAGLAANVRILPVRVIDTPPTSPLRPQSIGIPDPKEENLKLGTSSVELIARGMLYAITEHVQVINMSLGWPATVNSDVIADMIKLAQDQGIAVVAAAGNDSTDALVLPCSFPGVICVGAYGPDGLRASYSNRGPGVDFLAPGTSILSTYPLSLRAHFFTDLQGYEYMSGTSMSAPMVSGALAVLLGTGMNLDEAIARLIAGARVNEKAIGENLKIDLGNSLALKIRPVVRVTERAPIRLKWQDLGAPLTGSFHAKNLWGKIKNCSVQYELSPLLNTVSPATLQKTLQALPAVQNCANWNTSEAKTFPFQIAILGVQATRDFVLNTHLRYLAEDGTSYEQILQVEVQLVATPELVAKVLPVQNTEIVGKPVGNGTLIRTVISADAKSSLPKPEYMVLSRIKDGIAMQLLSTRHSEQYQYSDAQNLMDLKWGFLVAQRYYSYEVNATRIALLFRQTSEISGLTRIRFDIYDENLKTLVRTFSYDGSYAPLPENFRWTSLKGKDAIVFISNGKEAPTDDVWNQVLELTVSLRCYLLDASGTLSQMVADDNDIQTRIVDFVPYNAQDTDHDETSLLVIRGKDYGLSYFIGHLHDGKISSLDPFEITPYRNMGFLKSSPYISDTPEFLGTTLSSTTGRGHMRSTVLVRTGYSTIRNDDRRFSALDAEEGVSGVVGSFSLGQVKSFYTQTNYDLQLHEFTGTRENVMRTSMNRFSFLPTTVSQKAFYPILVKNNLGLPEPSVLTADIGSGFYNLSAVVPERDANGVATGFIRPALLSFEDTQSGCGFIGNPVWDKPAKGFRMNSFCGSVIRSVSLELPHE